MDIVKTAKCSAPLRGREGTCTRPAGWQTEHPGTGLCKYHGGLSQKPDTAPIEELVQQYLHDPEITTLDREIALARAVLASIDDPSKPTNIQNVVSLVNTISSLVKRKQELEMNKKYLVKVDLVLHVMHQLVAVTKRYVPNPLDQERLAHELTQAFSVPTGAPMLTDGKQ